MILSQTINNIPN